MKTILFDLDGTLIDSTDAILESFGVAYETFGRVVPEDDMIKKLIGHPLDLMFTMLGIDALDADAVCVCLQRALQTDFTQKNDTVASGTRSHHASFKNGDFRNCNN